MTSDFERMAELAAQLRIDSIRCTTKAGSGHPTSSMSAADLMAVLMTNYFRYDWDDPEKPNNDRLIFSKGHASPLLYSMYKAAGAIEDEELLSLRKLGSRLEGHPKPMQSSRTGLPWVDVATGSLGQGLPTAVGMGLAAKLDRLPFRIWVLLGDSEMAEGSVWEGFDKAGHYDLGNIVAILDVNRLGQTGPTELEWRVDRYAERLRAFGWNAITVDGHDLAAIDGAYKEAMAGTDQPSCIVAQTIKGYGVSVVANQDGWHGKALNEEQAKQAIDELGGRKDVRVTVQKPALVSPLAIGEANPLALPSYELGGKQSTRKAFGAALAALGAADSDMVVLDGEVGNSTYTEQFKKQFPERFFQIYIAEQQMVSAALGLSVLGKKCFAATFAAFLTRAFDQIRMAGVSGAELRLCGSHVGVSIGEDGPSQMGLEDIAMMRSVHGSTVLYPCDANQTAALVGQMSSCGGISYIRTTRGETPVIYGPDEKFPIGGSKIVRGSERDEATIVSAGITLHEALTACAKLEGEGVKVRVIDAYSVKPIDVETLRRAAADTGRIIVVEDHWAEGGLGDAVLDAFAGSNDQLPAVTKLAVRTMPGSATPQQELHEAGIDAEHIAEAVRAALRVRPHAQLL